MPRRRGKAPFRPFGCRVSGTLAAVKRRSFRLVGSLLAAAVLVLVAWLRRDSVPSPAPRGEPPAERPAPPPAEEPASRPPDPRPALRDLSADEARGGHTLRKHVGRTDGQLAERLRRESRVSAASSFTDRETAERVVGAAIAENADRIARWVARGRDRGSLVLDVEQPAPVGRMLRRGERRARDCSGGTVVLRADGEDWFVLTAYPEEEDR